MGPQTQTFGGTYYQNRSKYYYILLAIKIVRGILERNVYTEFEEHRSTFATCKAYKYNFENTLETCFGDQGWCSFHGSGPVFYHDDHLKTSFFITWKFGKKRRLKDNNLIRLDTPDIRCHSHHFTHNICLQAQLARVMSTYRMSGEVSRRIESLLHIPARVSDPTVTTCHSTHSYNLLASWKVAIYYLDALCFITTVLHLGRSAFYRRVQMLQ